MSICKEAFIMNKKNIVKKIKNIIYLIIGKKERRNPFYFEVHITDGCNLNCAGCDHFSPLASKDSLYPIEEFKSDLEQIYKVFGDSVVQLHIMGGEPLINPDINRYLDYARVALPKARLQLITNGILLKDMPNAFFENCIRNKIQICVSTYPINIDYTQLYSFVRSKGVDIKTFNVRSISNVWKNMGLSNEHLLNYKKTFLECKYANHCSNLRNGKLYLCPHAAYVHLFNEYFGENFDDSGTGISIYEYDKKEILDFLRTPNSFCKYCHINDPKNKRTNWSVSKRNKEEWIFKYEGSDTKR